MEFGFGVPEPYKCCPSFSFFSFLVWFWELRLQKSEKKSRFPNFHL